MSVPRHYTEMHDLLLHSTIPPTIIVKIQTGKGELSLPDCAESVFGFFVTRDTIFKRHCSDGTLLNFPSTERDRRGMQLLRLNEQDILNLNVGQPDRHGRFTTSLQLLWPPTAQNSDPSAPCPV